LSDSLTVDLGQTCLMQDSLAVASLGGIAITSPSGLVNGLSGVIVGMTVDMIHANTFTNMFIGGAAVLISGPLQVGVQTSDTDISGNFTDPTSGMTPGGDNPFPTVFRSGGIVWLNSGGGAGSSGGTFGLFTSGHAIASGFMEAAGFLRPHRYARALFISGAGAAPANQYVGQLQVGFIANYKTTGSGGGFAYGPSSGGAVNV